MKRVAWGALAIMVWTVVVFLVGRASIPDRSAEVVAWRDSAAVRLTRSTAADSARAAAELRSGAMIERALTAEGRLRQATARSAASSARVAELTQELAQAATLQDTVTAQAAIIEVQQEQIVSLHRSVEGAQEIMGDLRRDLQVVQEERAADQAEIRLLRGMIDQGLDVTRPSRGTGKTLKALALGVAIGVVGWEVIR